MKSKILSFLVVFTMLASMFGMAAVAAKTPMSLQIVPNGNKTEYDRSEIATLTVMMKDYEAANLLAIVGEYDSDVFSGVTAIKGELGAPVFNKNNLYSSWASATNFEVYDDEYELVSDFKLVTFRFTIAADAPFGETTVKVGFAQRDANGSVNTNMYYNGSKNVLMVPGTDYVTESATITLNIRCVHDFTGVEYTKPAEGTALEEAKHSRVCTKCEQTVTEACAFESKVTEPTHTEEGYTTHTCACGYVVVDSKTPAAGHDWGAFVHNETAEGQKHTHTRTCTANDGGSETEDCTFAQKYTDPTCTEDGYVTFTCGVCSYSYDVTDEGSAKGHSLTVYEHLNGTTHKKSCSVEGCGYSEEEACTFGAWEVTEEPTREKTGLKTRTCVHCKVGFETEVLPKVAYFTVSDASEACGHEFEVTVSLTNNPGLSGGVFEIAFDDTQMELIGAEVGALGADIPVLLQPANKVGDVYRIAFATEAGFEGDGELLKLKFRAADAVTEGDYTVSVGAIDVCDSSEEMVSFVIEGGAGTASLRNYLLGDIDRSGTVSVVDAVQLLRYLNDWDVTIEPYAAELDVNDGGITVADAQYLLQALIGLQTL